MKKTEFETLAAVQKIDGVELREVSPGNFELWAHSVGFRGSEDFKTALGQRRIWASIDTALAFIREMGYGGKIVIDTPKFESEDEMEVMSVFNSKTDAEKREFVVEIKSELKSNKTSPISPELLSKRELEEFLPGEILMTPVRLAQLRFFANSRGKKMAALVKGV
jgi:hypothetical protein